MSKRRLPKVILDQRANNMSDEALRCRADGHVWVRVMVPIDIVEQSIKQEGLVEKKFLCSGCTAVKTITVDAFTGVRLCPPTTKYADPTYLIRDGSGRMRREAAALADLARTYASFY